MTDTPTTGLADEIRLECEDDGWHLIVSTDTGDFDFRCHMAAFAFADSAGLRALREWAGEGRQVRDALDAVARGSMFPDAPRRPRLRAVRDPDEVPGRTGYRYGPADRTDGHLTVPVVAPDGRRIGDVTAISWIGVNDQPGIHELAADLIDQQHARTG